MMHVDINRIFNCLVGILIFMFFPLRVIAQNTLNEAIQVQLGILQKNPEDKEALRQLSLFYLNQANYDQCIEYANRLMKVGYATSDLKKSVLYAQIYLGQALMMKGGDDLYDAYNYLKQAKKTCEMHQLDSALCSVYNGLGLYAINVQKDYSGSLQYFFKGTDVAKRSNNKRLHGILLCNIAGVYDLQKDTTGLVYAQECYNLGHEEQDPFLSYIGAVRAAYMLHQKREFQNALKYAKETEFLMEQNDFSDYADVYALHGYILGGMGEQEEAESYFIKALDARKSSNYSSVLNAYLGYADLLMSRGDVLKAINLLQEGIEYSQAYPSAVFRSDLMLKLSECYEKKGDLAKALANYKIYKTETDSLYNLEKERVTDELRLKYNMERAENAVKQKQLELLEKENKLHLSLFLLLAILITSIYYIILYYRKRKLYKAIVRQNQEAIRREHVLKERIAVIEDNYASSSQTKYASSSLNEEKKQGLFQALEKMMTEDKIYTDNLLTKDKVAELLGSNRTYLSQIINEQTGKTFTQYINDYRIQDAIRQLSDPESQVPLKALSINLGFNSPTTFYKQFQTATGMTPAQYRNQVIELHKK